MTGRRVGSECDSRVDVLTLGDGGRDCDMGEGGREAGPRWYFHLMSCTRWMIFSSVSLSAMAISSAVIIICKRNPLPQKLTVSIERRKMEFLMSSQQLIKALSQQSTRSCNVGVTSCGGTDSVGTWWTARNWCCDRHLHLHPNICGEADTGIVAWKKKKTDTWWASQTKKPTLWSSSPASELSRWSYEHHVTGETDTTIILWEEETDITIITWERETDTVMVVSNFQRLNAELRKRDLNTDILYQELSLLNCGSLQCVYVIQRILTAASCHRVNHREKDLTKRIVREDSCRVYRC